MNPKYGNAKLELNNQKFVTFNGTTIKEINEAFVRIK